jgi:hypothetical protein
MFTRWPFFDLIGDATQAPPFRGGVCILEFFRSLLSLIGLERSEV